MVCFVDRPVSATADPLDAVAPAADALVVEHLDVAYRVNGRDRPVLRDVSFAIRAGEAYGLVGESGCGKSTIAFTAMRYLAANGRVTSGRVSINNRDVLDLDSDALRRLRATAVSMVYQDPGKSLNPSIPVGRQLAEVFELAGVPGAEARARAIAMLERVQIADPIGVMERYPHQLSGGMQQRVSIAMALSINPRLLILDEPTTGLDATVEAEVLELVARLRREFSTAILFISHNLAVIARMCDRVGVLYAGTLVEEGPTAEVFNHPAHPYTVSLLRCLPRLGQRKDLGRLETIPGFLPIPGAQIAGCLFADRCVLADDRCHKEAPALIPFGGQMTRCHYPEKTANLPRVTPAMAPADFRPVERDAEPVLRVRKLNKTFAVGGNRLRVLTDVSLELWPGETLGVVGESGSGKSTLAKLLLGLHTPDQGSEIALDVKVLAPKLVGRTAQQVKSLQMIFQNPDSALNRAHPVRRIVGRALTRLGGFAGLVLQERLKQLIGAVRLSERYLDARPRQLSGGLKQRVAIARAFAGEPRIVVCDEPTSALDVSVQAAILNLLADLQQQHRASYLFISHDVSVVRYISDRIAVFYLGRIMEIGPAEAVFDGPHHPYTEALLSAVPTLDGTTPGRIRLEGDVPSALNPPTGCVFHTRCQRKIGAICEQQEPELADIDPGHAIRCHLPRAELDRIAVPAAHITATV